MGPYPHDAPVAQIDETNVAGTDGFEFVEFAHPDPAHLERLLESMGYAPVAQHKSRDITLYRPSRFVDAHGPCAPAMAWRVVDAKHALVRALVRGNMDM